MILEALFFYIDFPSRDFPRYLSAMNYFSKYRCQTGVYVIPLLRAKLTPIDCRVIFAPTYSWLPPHKDPIEGYRQWRINITMLKAKEGGRFHIWKKGEARVVDKLFFCFDPASVKHDLSYIHKGHRCVISIGWRRKQNTVS